MVLTHDRGSFSAAAQERIERGQPVAGVIIVRQLIPIRQAIEEIQLLVEAQRSEEVSDRVLYVPLS